MVTKRKTRTIRVTEHTFNVLRKVAYRDPFRCSSFADFFGLVEHKNTKAIKAWQQMSEQLEEAK